MVQQLRWFLDYYTCKYRIKKKRDLQTITNERIVILMPHSDDEWIGCSQILVNNHENAIVIDMNMNGGDDEQLHLRRRNEAEIVAKEHDYKLYTLNDFNRFSDLSELLEKLKPSCVFLPSFIDWHTEHIEVMRLFFEAAITIGYAGRVGQYQVSVPIPEFMINAGGVMTKEQLKRKWDCFFKYYQTQIMIPAKRFLINERLNGAIYEKYAIEAYSITTFEYWKKLYSVLILKDEERRMLKENINRLAFVRNLSNDLLVKKQRTMS